MAKRKLDEPLRVARRMIAQAGICECGAFAEDHDAQALKRGGFVPVGPPKPPIFYVSCSVYRPVGFAVRRLRKTAQPKKSTRPRKR